MGRLRQTAPNLSDFYRLCDGQCILEFNAQITNRAVHLRVAKEELHHPQVAGLSVDLRNFVAPHRMGAIGAWLEADRGHPFPSEASILPRRDVRSLVEPPRPEVFRSGHERGLEPSSNRFPGPSRDLEAHRPPCLALDDRGPLLDLPRRIDVGDLEPHLGRSRAAYCRWQG